MGYTYEEAMAQVPSGAQKVISFFDGVSGFVGKAASWLCVPMILFLICEVFLRYGFNRPTVWANDLTVLLYGIMYMRIEDMVLVTEDGAVSLSKFPRDMFEIGV